MRFFLSSFLTILLTTSIFFYRSYSVEVFFNNAYQMGILLYLVLVFPFFAVAWLAFLKNHMKIGVSTCIFSAIFSLFISQYFVANKFSAVHYPMEQMQICITTYIIGGYLISMLFIVGNTVYMNWQTKNVQ